MHHFLANHIDSFHPSGAAARCNGSPLRLRGFYRALPRTAPGCQLLSADNHPAKRFGMLDSNVSAQVRDKTVLQIFCIQFA
jgi:hypothetical protein